MSVGVRVVCVCLWCEWCVCVCVCEWCVCLCVRVVCMSVRASGVSMSVRASGVLCLSCECVSMLCVEWCVYVCACEWCVYVCACEWCVYVCACEVVCLCLCVASGVSMSVRASGVSMSVRASGGVYVCACEWCVMSVRASGVSMSVRASGVSMSVRASGVSMVCACEWCVYVCACEWCVYVCACEWLCVYVCACEWCVYVCACEWCVYVCACEWCVYVCACEWCCVYVCACEWCVMSVRASGVSMSVRASGVCLCLCVRVVVSMSVRASGVSMSVRASGVSMSVRASGVSMSVRASGVSMSVCIRIDNMMPKQNESKRSIEYFGLNPPSSHPSQPFADTSGSFPINLSNSARNIHSLKKRTENWKQISEKSVQTDPMHDFFPPHRLGELRKQINFLIESLGSIFKSLEPDFNQTIGSSRSCKNKINEVTSAGDVDSNAIVCPAFWTQPSPKYGNRTVTNAERTVTDRPENKYETLKMKLQKTLDCAFKIKNAIPSDLQCSSSGTADPLHMPTGAIMTPGTQTEPVNTYVKFLQAIDDAAGVSSETTDNRSRSTGNRFSPGRMRMRMNRTRTVDATGQKQKWGSHNIDRRCSNYSLDNVLDETLNRKTIQNVSQKSKHLNLDATVSEVMSNHTIDGIDQRFLDTSEKSQPYVGSLDQRSFNIDTMQSADAAAITQQTNDKHFNLADYISALREVDRRSPATKRMREFSISSKVYFDFDDYYEKLINMRNKFKSVSDSDVSCKP
ncbi:hypothetical protein HNY73_014335 [Argiope bruennichi]|uniref:Uncharacterized protein n=1 Tax=Argiope bruennichi TaxID=94029 RepID=A0A8T0EPS1_ARGBR|nr:hypothetical protein HNY73_014335 [Argiope bruennichi]